MKFKKGFTLAEILIVLTAIGVIAMLTIPSSSKHIRVQRDIAAFKKAYNNVSSAYSAMISKNLILTSNDDYDVIALFKELSENIGANNYFFSGYCYKNFSVNSSMGGSVFFSTNDSNNSAHGTGTTLSQFFQKDTWIDSRDGVSYLVRPGRSSTCKKAADIQNSEDACAIIFVDFDGISNGNNTVCQSKDLASEDANPSKSHSAPPPGPCAKNMCSNNLTYGDSYSGQDTNYTDIYDASSGCDQVAIYVGIDGVVPSIIGNNMLK